ncbi:MAG TPA: AAA family ATPase [Anaerolineales bacterium]|nr:AAA family ATPase [Anaerolineales bacterium]
MKKSNSSARLIIVCGLPGSGKTTLAKCLEEDLHAVRLSPDEWMDALSINLYDEEARARIESLQWKLGQRLLKLGLVVIIEWGTWGKSERDALREGARKLGAAVELHYLSAPPEILFERIQRRNMENPPIKREDVLRWAEIIQVPTEEEMSLFDPASECKQNLETFFHENAVKQTRSGR